MKQVIIVDKTLNMCPGKLASVASRGAVVYFSSWLKENVNRNMSISDASGKYPNNYSIKKNAWVRADMFNDWVNNSFQNIILEANGRNEMIGIVNKTVANGLKNGVDYFNIVDDSKDFSGVPEWVAISFRPMDEEEIKEITGNLKLFGYNAPKRRVRRKDNSEQFVNDLYEDLSNVFADELSDVN